MAERSGSPTTPDLFDERSELRPKKVVLYRYLLRRHIAPLLGQVAIAGIQPSQVRRWRKQLLDGGVSAVPAAKEVSRASDAHDSAGVRACPML